MDGKLLVEKLLRYAVNFLHLNKRDVIYMRNILLKEFNLDAPVKDCANLDFIDSLIVPDVLTKEIEDYALENGFIEDGEQNLYSTYIFGLLSPLPSKVNETFMALKEESIEKACAYLYDLGIKNDYIKKTAIEKNLKWEYEDGNRLLEITINLSKPEKSNKDIAKLLTAPKAEKYPSCLLCKENEGFKGTLTHPARENIRTISLTMGGEPWFVQYSPYAYYEEHMIAISEKHTPMHIERDTVHKLADFVDFFPNYMIGSNASLPIVGGSILNHEHFQGGKHLMPMHKAPIEKEYSSSEFSSVKIGKVDWYNSVIRLESQDRNAVLNLVEKIINAWKYYSDEENYIFAETNGEKHNSLSPVCRKQDNKYIFDIILRNNITNEEYPEGVFHAHPEYHNIKKEGIGLIEAMGLFILPGRLKQQLNDIADILCKNVKYSVEELGKQENFLFVHRNMIASLVATGFVETKEKALEKVTNCVNETCKNILYNTAVFKNNEVGQKGFDKFLNSIGIFSK